MAYEGEIITACPANIHDFANTYAVVVSGSGSNFCGHLILNVGGVGGKYMHVAGLRTYPREMDQKGYERYLKENGKREMRRSRVIVPHPEKAMLKLEELLASKWTWGVLPHNCASFVEEVTEAGGSTAGLYSNCPALEVFD